MDYYFDANHTVSKLCAMWRPGREEKLWKKILHYGFILFTVVYVCTLYPIYELLAADLAADSLTDFIFFLKLVLSHLSGTARFYLWHYNYDKFFKILDDLKTYSDPEIYQDETYEEMYKTKARVNKIRSYVLAILAGSLAFPRNVAGTVRLFFDDNQFRNNGTAIELGFITRIPWNYQESVFKFFMAIVFQTHACCQQGCIVACFLFYYMGILENIAMQFDMIKRACGTHRARVEKLSRNDVDQNVALLEMKKITKHIQTVIRICEDMEDIFTYIMLFQIVFSLGTLCFCIYMLSMVPFGSATFIGEIIYWIALSIELFVYSYYGTKVTYEGMVISTALFHTDWYDFDRATRSTILINMIRMQQPIYFTIGKFQPISLATFVSISKGAYSLYAVLETTK